jgi:hypothetical protein
MRVESSGISKKVEGEISRMAQTYRQCASKKKAECKKHLKCTCSTDA